MSKLARSAENSRNGYGKSAYEEILDQTRNKHASRSSQLICISHNPALVKRTKSWFPLTAKHRLNNVLMYEQEGRLKIGLEACYFSPQKLSDGTTGKSYWICGVMAEKLW